MRSFGKFYLPIERILAVVPLESASVKRMKQAALHEGKVLDLTYGKKSRTAILLDSGHVVITYHSVKELMNIIWGKGGR